ncbi:MAG: FtsX-like permease family protein, partial [Acidobacteria bacterium]
ELRILAGRTFDRGDADDVLVVNRSAAEILRETGPGPRGTATLDGVLGGRSAGRQIIGVVEDAKRDALAAPREPTDYVLMHTGHAERVAVVVRCSHDMAAVKAAVGRLAETVPREVIVESITTMDDHLAVALWRERVAAIFAAVCALLSTALAAVGTFAVASQSVLIRHRDLSIRLAVGAEAKSLITKVVAQFVGFAAIGACAGVWVVLLMRRVTRSLEIAHTQVDPVLLGAAVLGTLLVTAVACYLAARRIAELDVVGLLRSE